MGSVLQFDCEKNVWVDEISDVIEDDTGLM